MSIPGATTRLHASLNWRPTLLGILLGAALVTMSVAAVWNEVPRPNVPIMAGAFSLILSGIFVAYIFPGRSMPESALAGAVIAALTVAVLSFGVGIRVAPATALLGLPAGSFLAMTGGWVGNLMQGSFPSTAPSDDPEAIQWPWVSVGIVLGCIMTCYIALIGRALVGLSSAGVLFLFAAICVLVGLFMALLSKTGTLLESALAGLGLVAVNVLIGSAVLGVPFPIAAIAIAFSGAFFLSLAGGWIGELVHARMVLGEHS
jgi:hypothetical protein